MNRISNYLGNTLLEMSGRVHTTVDPTRTGTAGYSYLTGVMGAEIGDIETGSNGNSGFFIPLRQGFGGEAGKPYDEGLKAHAEPRAKSRRVARRGKETAEVWFVGIFPFRNYSPELARWTSADPMGFPDGPNRHFYAPVPTMGLDPLGLDVLVLNNRDSVGGAGHGATMVGNDTDGYTYHSFGKNSKSQSEYDDANGQVFADKAAALDYAKKEGYDRFVEIKTNTDQDDDARSAASAYEHESYNFSVNNCMDLVNDTVNATGEMWISRKLPNLNFNENRLLYGGGEEI